MARSLRQLKESIERIIEQQGEDAPVAAFIFTKEDVYTLDKDYVPVPLKLEDADEVLNSVEENDWIYEQIFSCIEDEIKERVSIK